MQTRTIQAALTLMLVFLLAVPAPADELVRMGPLDASSDILADRILLLDVSEPVSPGPAFSRAYDPPVQRPKTVTYLHPDDSPVRFLDKAHEEAEKDLVTDFMRDTTLGMLGSTRLGQQADWLSDLVSSYFRLEFTKKRLSEDLTWLLPGQAYGDAETDDPRETVYGLSFSTRFRLNTSELVEDVVLECRSTLLRNNARLSWEMMEDQLRLDFNNTELNRYLGADIHVEFSGSPDSTSGALLIRKTF